MSESIHTAPPSVGTLVGGRYRLEELAGTGGMAQVWAATDTVLGRRVAVKLLHPHLRSDDALLRRFRQEGRLSARLTDPSIVGVYDTVATADADAIVMELVDGTTLRRLLDERGRLDPETVVDLGCRVADALDVAHRGDLTHRDIKPANILLCADGGVKVADFGIAKTGDLDDLTRDGTLVGTATYLAPEQLRGEPTDGRADLYALGVVLYEALCGRPPFSGENEVARAVQRLHHVPTPPHRVVSGIPVALSRCVMHALERDPARRPATAGELRAELADSLEPTAPQLDVELRAPAPVRRAPGRRRRAPRRAPRRSRLGVVVLALVVAGSVSLLAALLQDGPPAPGSPERTAVDQAAPVAVPIREVASFDPLGSGTPGENDRRLPALLDLDAATAWSTERYDRRDFGTKPGVGILVQLDRVRRVREVRADSTSRGWTLDAFVLESRPLAAPAGRPDAAAADVSGDARLAIGGRRGAWVLLWITRLGEDAPRYHVSVTSLQVLADP